MTQQFEIYAIRYGHLDKRVSSENFFGGDEHDVPMPLDYFVWAIVGPNSTYLLDTGFDEKMGAKRKRTVVRPVQVGLEAIGIKAESVKDIIISHMHFDHAGNHDIFPNARYHVQDKEIAYCTGRCMCHPILRHAFELEDVQAMVSKLYSNRLVFHDGDAEIEPGLTVHHLGGHTQGLQIVRVNTRRGWVVLGSDASHFYANFEDNRPFPSIDSMAEMLAGYDRMRELASSPKHIIPGHDPLVLKRYPLVRADLDAIVRLDADPNY
jgi:glyoxylase-like metal-dependent hydrolase (beta-lactamase superfamily II)